MWRFKEQTDRDLREALVNYAVMQISMCKKVECHTRFPCPHHRLKLLPLAGNPGVEQCKRVFPEDVTVVTLEGTTSDLLAVWGGGVGTGAAVSAAVPAVCPSVCPLQLAAPLF